MKTDSCKKLQCSKAIRNYFKDFIQCLIVFDSFLVISFIIASAAYPWNNWNLVLLAMILISPLLYIKMIVFYVQVRKDLKRENISTETITVKKIAYDKAHNMYNRGGAITGKIKYILTTDDNRKFSLCTDIDAIAPIKNCKSIITYTNTTKVLLSFLYNKKDIITL